MKEFYDAGIKFAKVELKEGEYKNVSVAQQCLRHSAKRHGLAVRPFIVNHTLYLENVDL